MNAELVKQICEKLTGDELVLKKRFLESSVNGCARSVCIDDLLPENVAEEIYNCFPKKESDWRLMDTFRERKFTSKDFDKMPALLRDITFAIQAPEVIEIIERISGIVNQEADPMLYAGGLSMMRAGDFLNPHIDNSHNQQRDLYRVLNLLYYVTPEWQYENGGNLELWDDKVKLASTTTSKFNRLVLMETTKRSWHSVSPVIAPGYRCCVSNYYFSVSSPDGGDYHHVTSFSARPEQKFKRVISYLDGLLRAGVRSVIKGGVGKQDVYKVKR